MIEPHILDAFEIVQLLCFRVGVVKAQIAIAAVRLCVAEVNVHGLGMSNVKNAIGLWRETSLHLEQTKACLAYWHAIGNNKTRLLVDTCNSRA